MIEYICTKCHYVGRPKKKKRGSDKAAFMAWLIFPFGLPYTIWRTLTKTNICRHCAEIFLVSVNSPAGKRLIEITEAEIADERSINTIIKKLPIEQKTPPAKQEEPKPRSTRQQNPDEW